MANQFNRCINFSAGPSRLPEEILVKAASELLNYDQSGCSVMELSHRSAQFANIITEAEKDLRELMSVPDTHAILFVQGGGSGQFSAIPLNLLSNSNESADYLITGTWSDKSYKEALKFGKVKSVTPSTKVYTSIPDPSTWNLSSDAKYFYYCANETIHGVEWQEIPSNVPENIPLVSDMSSNFMTRAVDVSKFGLIYAAAQKNIGIGGLTVVIVRKDLLGKAQSVTPIVFDYKTMADNNSLYNTPPCFAIYMTGLYLKWIKEKGGLSAMEENSKIKSDMIYNAIEQSNGFYYSPVAANCRSRVTIPFRVGGSNGNPELEAKFLKEAQAAGMIQLKGHRSVGGIRASLFNAISIEDTRVLEQFMINFMKANSQ